MTMETQLAVAERFKSLGFTHDLRAAPVARIRCSCGVVSDASACSVGHIARFEGDSNPDDEAILVALTLPCGHRGLLTGGYGPTTDPITDDVLHALPQPRAGSEGSHPSASRAEPVDMGGDPPCWAHLIDYAETTSITEPDLALLVHELADAVIICDPSGTIIFWNEAATRVFGWSRDETLGGSLDLIIPPRLRERHWQGWHKVIATGQTIYADRLLEVPALGRDGQNLSIAFTVSLLRDQAGSIRVIAAVIRDDTQRWRERRELRLEIERLSEQARVMVGEVDQPGPGATETPTVGPKPDLGGDG